MNNHPLAKDGESALETAWREGFRRYAQYDLDTSLGRAMWRKNRKEQEKLDESK